MKAPRWLALASVFFAAPAHAWYFPEHAQMTEAGLLHLPPQARQAFERALQTMAARPPWAICSSLETPYYDQTVTEGEAKISRACIPYGALPALAADHSTTAKELEVLLTSRGERAALYHFGAIKQWREFVEDVRIRGGEAHVMEADRKDLVRDLDVFLQLSDSDYLARARVNFPHFQDTTRWFGDQVEDLATKGAVGNTLAQFIVHHLRSLALASKARTSTSAELLREAFTEHAFALHSLQDAHAAGHMAVDQETAKDDEKRLRRHDYFNRNGLAATFALNSIPCPQRPEAVACWETFGDGFLGLPEEEDHDHVAFVVAQVQLQLAIALDPKITRSIQDGNCSGEGSSFGALLESDPWWSDPSKAEPEPLTCTREKELVTGYLAALAELAPREIPAIAGNDVREAPGVLSGVALGCPLASKSRKDVCRGGQTAIGRSILRPILARWPAPQSEVDTLVGDDPFGRGFGYQLWIAPGATGYTTSPITAGGSFLAAVGISYRLHDVLPGAPNFALLELNAGIREEIRSGSTERFRGQALLELRTNLPLEATRTAVGWITQASASDFFPTELFDYVSFFDGARLVWDVTGEPLDGRPDSLDFEVLTFVLPMDREVLPQERIARLPLMLRLRLGVPLDDESGGLLFGVEVAAGISRLF